MSNSLDIYPFRDTDGLLRFGVQIVIFLIGIVLAQKLVIAPAMRLYEERKKRTSGNVGLAKQRSDYANQIEHEYFTNLREGVKEAQKLRQQKILVAQEAANKIIAENQAKASVHLSRLNIQLTSEMQETKLNLRNQVEGIVSEIYKKIGVTTLGALLIASAVLYGKNATALDEKLIPSFWYSVFWPYFQFLCFLVAIVYFAKKPIANLLEKQREDLKTRLSEAREAVTLAERKVVEYENKLSTLQKEILELKTQHLEDAKLEEEHILIEARKYSESILRDAERVSRELIMRSREEIRKDLYAVAIEEVEKRLTPEKLSLLDMKLKKETIDVVADLASTTLAPKGSELEERNL